MAVKYTVNLSELEIKQLQRVFRRLMDSCRVLK
jgi:hypothetical protein